MKKLLQLKDFLPFQDSSFQTAAKLQLQYQTASFCNCKCSFMAAYDGCYNYHVFISYRWKGIGNTFVGFLHSALKREGLDAYIDGKTLPRGEEMLACLFRIIRNSKIWILVISKDYADSKRCLIELAEMVECYESNCHILLPVFLDVDPKDVQNQTGIFEAWYEKHKKDKENDEQTITRWKNALTVVTGIPGYELKEVDG
ncbi:hypothetical protein NE237_016315 [Protea cynaroides]|uniref:ADP-ribosyl cyclase/cyclic ADP-ribose hydrolase n=1 Tax=Protea cynaroides TaxID=273540 RepID=A0A9Q0JQX3_9MAGN|nr:hypothetical protein NE237_016315 [Protea cynaroides]